MILANDFSQEADLNFTPYQQAQIGQVKAHASRYADTAALLQSLGGGWWNRKSISTALVADQNQTKKQ